MTASVLKWTVLVALVSVSATSIPARSQVILHDRTPATSVPDPEDDPNKVVITDIAHWHHPTKAIFAKYEMVLTKVVLVHNRTYPIFHVADFHADPTSGMTNSFFNRFDLQLLEANGYNGFTVVEDNFHDGYRIGYDKKQHRIMSDLLVEGDR